MMCLALGLGVLGFAAMRHARHCHGGGCHGYHHSYRWHGHHHGRGRRWMLHATLARIDATPAQERAIIAEIDRLGERIRGARHGLIATRGDLAAALRGSTLDDAALGAVLGRVDAATGEARAAMLDALRGIHGLLDDKQRAQVAEMLDHGGGWWRSGPYR